MACVDLFASIATAVSVPKSIGQIYGLLYASPVPLSFSDILERLDISKGSVSQGLGLLKALGAISEAQLANVSGNKRASLDHAGADAGRNMRVSYVPELSLRRLISGIMRERISPLAADGAIRLRRLQELARQSAVNGDFYLNRAKQLQGWRRQLRAVIPVLSVMLGPKRGVDGSK